MILKRSLEVSGTAQAVRTAGRKNEYSYMVMKKGKELRRDIEATLLSNITPAAGSTSTARAMRPLLSWYTTNVLNTGSGGANGDATHGRTDGAQAALTEATFKSAIQAAWSVGGYPSVALCGPINRVKISGFAGPTGTYRTNEADSKALVVTVDVYRSDFGDIKVTPDRFQRERDLHLIDPDFLAVASLRDIRVEDRAKSSDAEKAEILWEGTLEVRNEASCAVVVDLTDT